MKTTDLIVIGGGIVGLATAHVFLQQYPHKTVLVLEKEDRVGFHQSGRNSGVLHSGIYYRPGSLKAATCREGKKAMQDFCAEEGIPYKLCGKVIVALDGAEVERLHALYERGMANGIDCEIIDPPRLLEIEPHAAGVKAIHIPDTGVVDYRQVCERLASRVRGRGQEVLVGARVVGLRQTSADVVVESEAGEFAAEHVINCAGLHSDRVAALGGEPPPVKIVPFRGEYFKLKAEAEHLCRGLIYPVPDPRFPFLGVHFTRMIEGGVECGPNAVIAFAREGYHKTDINVRDLFETLTYSGFIKLARKYWQTGAGEMLRSFSRAAFVRALQRLVPDVRAEHLAPAEAGVRAQAVASDGAMLDDFSFQERPRVLNVINAPSPAATASLSIAGLIVKRLAARF
ncbi:MAG TPA: L-2-hydroxyglutarate oxidase [Blastocatellia bacterium]|jgi:L-2-hydroxyglutarate oxidase|nr:L-2-hydroxyglutarate oxidase [Blastocatellia bacterium]